MNLMEKFGEDAGKKSLAQFCQPRCYEFAGKDLNFVVDTGEGTGNYLLHVIDKKELEWSWEGS
ncbi:MAG: hypothetical protein IKE94_16995, partial [Aeriscardovia sp.]|nr:hypothetical protein [Aeriscardovia sp.]